MKLKFLFSTLFLTLPATSQCAQAPDKKPESPLTRPLLADEQRQMVFDPEMQRKIAVVEAKIQEIFRKRKQSNNTQGNQA